MSRSCNNSPRFADKYLVIATSNENKFFEIRTALGPLKIPVNFLRDYNNIPESPETGSSFSENARQKADFYYGHLQQPLLAEDSGLVIPALHGFPGLHSARVGKDDAERISLILEKMRPVLDRSAYYVCSMIFRTAGGSFAAEGTCKGRILEAPEGNLGFGYDPIFQADDAPRPFGLMTIKEKSNYSHRASAVRKLIPEIQTYFSNHETATSERR